MKISQTIDWLGYTILDPRIWKKVNERTSYLTPTLYQLTNVTGAWVPETPHNGFTMAFRHAEVPGLSVTWHHSRDDMGVRINWSGSALQGRNILGVMALMANHRGRCGRIDLAVDVDAKFDMEIMHKQFKRRECVTNARKSRLVRDEGDTLYVGARTSEKYLRIYDKAAEQGITDREWTRVELECKGEFAHGIFMYIIEETVPDFRDVIRGFVDFTRYVPWNDAMTSPTPVFGLPQKEKIRDTEKWLLEVVTTALSKAAHARPAFLREWSQKMGVLLQDMYNDPDPFDGAGDFFE